MSGFNYDLLIIGAGPAGIAAARRAASYDAKVAIVERDALGGTCVNRGCVPKKLMVYAADFPKQWRVADAYGWSKPESTFNWSELVAALHHHIRQINHSYRQTLNEAGVDLLQGQASFVDAHTLSVADRTITAERVLIAVGGKPTRLKIPGIDRAITSRDVFHLKELPRHLAIMGGGYIGVEFASVLRDLDCNVTIIDVEDAILSGFDDDLRHGIQQGLTQAGIQVITETSVKEIQPDGNQLNLHLSGQTNETIAADAVLCAVGRSPNLDGLNLDRVGVETTEKGAIAVDEYSRTSCETIYAVGDCTDRVPLTPAVKAEAQAFADTVFGDRPRTVDYQWVPSAVFARPEAAAVGLTETEARSQHGDQIKIYSKQFQPLFHSLTGVKEPTFMKLITHQDTDRVLGLHVLSESAAEIVQSLAVAIRKGITKAELDDAIGIHPTNGEELFSLE